jgi:hypothetical protein
MELSDNQKKILEESLLNKWFNKGPTCPICQGTEWEVSPTVFEIPEFQSKNRQIIPKLVFPVIIIICNTCSNCVTFSAVKLGLIKAEPDTPTEDTDKGVTK